MRAILDANVLIAAILARRGTPARLLVAWREGAFDLVISPRLTAELRRALAYPKIRRLVSEADADAYIAWLAASAELAADPLGPPPVRSEDPDDDYLIALAAAERAILVSGDHHLTSLADRIPVITPAEFVARLDIDTRG